MIVSVSRRTDIPAFYAPWFMERLREGFCRVPNPFNPNQVSRVSLLPADVDAFVFWTKDPRPLIPYLGEIEERGIPFYFQFTLNDYPRAIEAKVPPLEERVGAFLSLARRLGKRRMVWRYDPILVTPKTSHAYHLEAFGRLGTLLRGSTERVVISLADRYRKTERRLGSLGDPLLQAEWEIENDPRTLELLSGMGRLAALNGMEIFTCAEQRDYSAQGVRPGACIDPSLLGSLGVEVPSKKDPGQRKECLCAVSRDIGAPDTCLHGCLYCYATKSDEAAAQRHAAHSPHSPSLEGNTGSDS